jgi:orotate phosphoribosyltransferase
MSTPLALPSSALTLASALVETSAICVATERPFFYTSGWASPVYLKTSGIMSVPAIRRRVMDAAATLLGPIVKQQDINAIVGIESSGIALGAYLAERLDLPFLYLRKRALGWGTDGQLEGHPPAKARALLVDDVTTDGRTKVEACLTLRRCGVEVQNAFVLLNYGIYPNQKKNFDQHGLNLHAMLSWQDLISVISAKSLLNPDQLKSLKDFTSDPIQWSVANGGAAQ